MLTLIAFVVTVAVLVAVHEWGHFSVARICGVKVLQFSLGLGPRIGGWTSPTSGTDYVVRLFPLGGFVRMLDEREAPVAPTERRLAFNTQPLRYRVAIVAAGPIANLLLAVIVYACVNWTGVEQAQALLARPAPGSVLAQAGFTGGERVVHAGFEGSALEGIRSFDEFRWWLARGAIEHRNVQVEFIASKLQETRTALLSLRDFDAGASDAQLMQKLGVSAPFSQARLGTMLPSGAAVQAKLQMGDVVLRVDQTNIVDAAQLRAVIRDSGRTGTPHQQVWLVERQGQVQSIFVTPRRELDAGVFIGRVGASIGASPATVTVQYGLVEGILAAFMKTWESSALTVQIFGQILIGKASLNNLSGPVTIADYAGKSAAMGLPHFLEFLAVVSISLGVLNLLPLPILDGGHLMYYLWEALSGKPVTLSWAERLQKVGLVILFMMMSIAIMNDLTHLLR